MSKTKKLVLVLGGAFLACASGVIASRVARATPPVGVTAVPIAGPVAFGEIDAVAHTGNYKTRLKTWGLSDGYVRHLTIAPGGGTGWHSHPGIVFVLITAGTATFYDECDDFTPQVYPAGTGFVEDAGCVHLLANEGNADVELIAFFLVPKGAPPRIDEPAPQ